jgi:hypothetical protein
MYLMLRCDNILKKKKLHTGQGLAAKLEVQHEVAWLCHVGKILTSNVSTLCDNCNRVPELYEGAKRGLQAKKNRSAKLRFCISGRDGGA